MRVPWTHCRRQLPTSRTHHEEDLLEPPDGPVVPGRLEIDAVRVAANQVLRKNHDEALEARKMKPVTGLLWEACPESGVGGFIIT